MEDTMTTTLHHPSCPQRHGADHGCLCGPETLAEDRVILMERDPDAMLLDVLAHAQVGYRHLLARPIRWAGRAAK
jgi:hypothetical protein